MSAPARIPVTRVKPGDVIEVVEVAAPVMAAVIGVTTTPEGDRVFVTEVGTYWHDARHSVRGFAA